MGTAHPLHGTGGSAHPTASFIYAQLLNKWQLTIRNSPLTTERR
ncbi:hypothetical protein [Trichocoleus sp. ST-U1]